LFFQVLTDNERGKAALASTNQVNTMSGKFTCPKLYNLPSARQTITFHTLRVVNTCMVKAMAKSKHSQLVNSRLAKAEPVFHKQRWLRKMQ